MATLSQLPIPLDQVDSALVSFSGGKDSTASLLIALETFGPEKVTAIFADTGAEHPDTYAYLRWFNKNVHPVLRLAQRAEDMHRTQRGWENKLSLVELKWSDSVGAYDTLTFKDYVLRRKMRRPDTAGWPSPGNRYCTKSMKQQAIQKWTRAKFTSEQRMRVIHIIGLRRAEGKSREQTPDYVLDPDVGTWTWYPIAAWSDRETSAYVHKKGVPLNPEYAESSRVGCTICFYGSAHEVATRESNSPGVIARFVELDQQIGSWQKSLSLVDVQNAAQKGITESQLPLLPENEQLSCMSGYCDMGTSWQIPQEWLWDRPRHVIADQDARDYIRDRLEKLAGLRPNEPQDDVNKRHSALFGTGDNAKLKQQKKQQQPLKIDPVIVPNKEDGQLSMFAQASK